jgi:hypothetical protein
MQLMATVFQPDQDCAGDRLGQGATVLDRKDRVCRAAARRR